MEKKFSVVTGTYCPKCTKNNFDRKLVLQEWLHFFLQ